MTLEREFDFFIEHQERLVREHRGRVVAIKDQRVVGVFDSELEAVEQTSKHYEIGTFLVQKCEPGVEAYTQVFHSPLMA